MADYTESELEQIENVIVDIIDNRTRTMSKENKDDLIEMIISSLESLKDE